MTAALLKTKLFIPPLRPNLVPRPRLIEDLNHGQQLGHKLTLVSAPAGFGKSTLVSEWIDCCQPQAAWLSLDDGDSDPTRFLTYLVAALQTLALGEVKETSPGTTSETTPVFGEELLALLQSPQPAPVESILTSLLNEISSIQADFVLVLDDYHLIDSRPVDKALTFLLEHLPPQMHLVIATREDPNIPLARLRVRGQLSELRVKDLRFTAAEAASFLNQVMNLNLAPQEIAALESHTEGWIAGLQLAAISMQGRADAASFIRAFTGSHHFILDYLVEEVLQRQPTDTRSFLLQTSILDRLTGSLCDAVTGQDDGKGMLLALDRSNLFVIPLDDRRHWYRYHHLFADVLQTRLMEEQPALVPALHQRASAWYERDGSLSDAIRHALDAKDFERVARLAELAWPAMDWSFQSSTWLRWAKALPDELVRARPVLSASYGWALINNGELEAGEARLRDAERWLDIWEEMREQPETVPAVMIVTDEEQFRSLPVTIASARAYLAQASGDAPGSVKYSRLALDLLPEGDHLARGRAAVLLGVAQWTNGELEAAHHSFAGAMASFQMAGNILYAISFTFILAEIKVTQGRLREAVSTYERSLQLAMEQKKPVPEGPANLYLGLSELHRERGDPEAARKLMQISTDLGDEANVYQYRRCRAQARLEEDLGDLDGALELLDEADRWLQYRNPLPDLRPVSALKTRIWVAQGRLADAEGWVRERGLSVDDALSYLHEFEHITLARVLIGAYKSGRGNRAIQDAAKLLERLLRAAEEGGRMGSVIEILILQAILRRALDDIPRALNPLKRALKLAKPEGYVRIFVDEGPAMAALLQEVQKQGTEAPNYVSHLLSAFGAEEDVSSVTQGLIDPLSERELEVLRLLDSEMNGPEIASELMISLNTMRTHTKNIYSKLGVNNRRSAVRRAGELGLL